MTYNQILERIAGHLVTHHGCPADVSGEMAAKLVQDCSLATIIVASTGLPRDKPRQTFGGEATSL